jgi:hypothetical protein
LSTPEVSQNYDTVHKQLQILAVAVIDQHFPFEDALQNVVYMCNQFPPESQRYIMDKFLRLVGRETAKSDTQYKRQSSCAHCGNREGCPNRDPTNLDDILEAAQKKRQDDLKAWKTWLQNTKYGDKTE